MSLGFVEEQEKAIAELLKPFTKKPYAGIFLKYLLFEESCTNSFLLESTFKNLTDQDYK